MYHHIVFISKTLIWTLHAHFHSPSRKKVKTVPIPKVSELQNTIWKGKTRGGGF
jgi:hypothetical protein